MLFFSWLSNLCLEITLSLVFCRFYRRASNLFHMVNCCRLVSPSRVFLSPFMMTEVSIWLFKVGKRSLIKLFMGQLSWKGTLRELILQTLICYHGTYIEIRLRHFLPNHRDDIRVARSRSVKSFWSKISSGNTCFWEFSHISGRQETYLDILNWSPSTKSFWFRRNRRLVCICR